MFNNEDHIVKSAFGSSIIFVVQTETLTCNLLALKVQTDETKPVD